VLREAAPPRNDIAQKVTWDLAEFSGRSGVVEVTDGNSGSGFAWIAFGRFEPELPQLGFGGHANASRGIRVAVDLVRTLKMKEFGPTLTKFALTGAMDPDTRTAAARALLGGDPAKAIPQIATIVSDSGAPAPLREKFAAALAEARTPAAIAVIATALRDAPHRLQQSFAMVLAGSPEGAEMVLAACAEGKAPALLLRDKALVDRLKAAKVPDIDKRLATLTANLPQANAVIDKLIATRRSDFNPTTASAARGADVFARNCAVCHTIEGKGGMLGPQLDGIGGRGSDRLLEDILDPNRNVDRAFRMMVVTLKDKSVVGGLFRGEQGAQIVFADAAGKESRVAKDDIVERKETETSLMPPSFGETIPPGEFNDLLAFLLGRRPAK
jgi:putative heme-binding domain-containing protein